MKTSYAASFAFALTALAAGQAMAAKAPYVNETNMPTIAAQAMVTTNKSRAEVNAELAQAQRTGDISLGTKSVADETNPSAGTTLNSLFPAQFPAQPVVAGKSRAEVRAELAQAQRAGDISLSTKSVADETNPSAGTKLNALFPAQFPAQPVVASKSRADVRAELAAAKAVPAAADVTVR